MSSANTEMSIEWEVSRNMAEDRVVEGNKTIVMSSNYGEGHAGHMANTQLR